MIVVISSSKVMGILGWRDVVFFELGGDVQKALERKREAKDQSVSVDLRTER